MANSDELITVRIPRGHWNQIVDDLENWCGVSAKHIEILQEAFVVEDAKPKKSTPTLNDPQNTDGQDSRFVQQWKNMTDQERFAYRYPDFEG